MRRKIKNTVLKGFTACMGVICLIAIVSADNAPVLATITVLASGAWLVYYGKKNGYFDFNTEGAFEDDF